jgi:voltage-gated sodium channel
MVGAAAAVSMQKKKKKTKKKVPEADAIVKAPTIEMLDMNIGCCSNTGPDGNGCKCHSIFALIFREILVSKVPKLGNVFGLFIIGVIFLAALLVGLSTYTTWTDWQAMILLALDEIVMGIFIAECLVKILAEGKQPWEYWFHITEDRRTFCRDKAKIFCCDPNSPADAGPVLAKKIEGTMKHKVYSLIGFMPDYWNIFDSTIVGIGLMPFDGGAVTALRLIRLLRVLKLVRALPELQILVISLIGSLEAIAYIGLLLLLLFYLYAVIGVTIFGENDPVHMGVLHVALVTLFRCSTLEDWTDVMYIAMDGCDKYGYDGMMDKCVKPKAMYEVSALYFISFIVISSMMILNLFIGVITSSMTEAKEKLLAERKEEMAENATGVEAVVVRDLDELLKQIKDIEEKIQSFADEEKAHAHAHNRVKAEAGKVLIATPGEKINLRTYTEPVPAVEDATPTL